MYGFSVSSFSGQVAVSQLIGYKADNKNMNGYYHRLGFGKTSGRFNFNVSQEMADDKYQQNDLGFFNNNNYLDHYLWVGYRWVQPRAWYKNVFLNFNGFYSTRYKPSDYQDIGFNVNVNGTLKNLWNFGLITDLKAENQNFYEPRIPGKKFRTPSSWMKGFWIGTNRAKKYSMNIDVYNRTSSRYKLMATDIMLYQRFRFNDRLSLGLGTSLQPRIDNVGFAFIPFDAVNNRYTDTSVFARRDIRTMENTLNVKYNFNNRMGLTIRLRHYWSKVENKQFYQLKDDGYLQDIATPSGDYNYNVNYFNVDLVYTWQFGPGSFVNFVWKDASQVANQDVRSRYFKNLDNTLDLPQANSLSLKVIYFLDYLDLKKKKR